MSNHVGLREDAVNGARLARHIAGLFTGYRSLIQERDDLPLAEKVYGFSQRPPQHGEDACCNEPGAGQCVRRCGRNARP